MILTQNVYLAYTTGSTKQEISLHYRIYALQGADQYEERAEVRIIYNLCNVPPAFYFVWFSVFLCKNWNHPRDLQEICPFAISRGQFCTKMQTPEWSEVKSLSRVWLFATPWTIAYQAPPSMRFSRQEYWSGLPFPSPGDLPNPGIEPGTPAVQADALTSEPPGKPRCLNSWYVTAGDLPIPGLGSWPKELSYHLTSQAMLLVSSSNWEQFLVFSFRR